MITCEACGELNAIGATRCAHCGESLGTMPVPPPQLLAQIQGLIPAEPFISSGQPTGAWSPLKLPAEVVREVVEPVKRPESLRKVEPAKPQRQGGRKSTPKLEPAPLVIPPKRKPPPPAIPPRPLPASPPRLILALALLAAIFVGLRWPLFGSEAPPRRPDVDTVFTFIEILPPGARVLLAWDYEPTTQGELQLLAEPILVHLRQKGARVANMSLRATGPAVAADAFAAAYSRPFAAGALAPPPVELGFIPGEAAALQALALAPVQAANLPELGAQALGMAADDPLTAFDLVIEFSAETATSRQWVEQIAVRGDMPLVVAASGAVAPALRPYVQTGQLEALLTGYSDALAYESLLGVEEGSAAKQGSAQTLAHFVFLGIVLVALTRGEGR